jgi:MYXO-CTERM domain-containing protein
MGALLELSVMIALAGDPVVPAVGPAEPHGTPRSAAAPGDQDGAHVATLGTTSMLVWSDERGGAPPDLWTTRLLSNGTLPAPAGARAAPGPIASSGIAAGNGLFWRVWMVGTAPPYTMYGQLSRPDGTTAGQVLQLGPPVKGSAPGAAWSGQEFVTVWADLSSPQLVGARTTIDGSVQTVNMSQGTPADSASVACGPGPTGTVCLVVYMSPSPPPPPQSKDIHARFFDPATLAWVSADVTVSATANDEINPVVAYQPTRDTYVLAWRESAASADVKIAALKFDGSMVGPVALEASADDEMDPAVSCRPDGADLCVIATRDDSAKEIHLWRLHGDLSRIDATPAVFPAIKDSENPTVSLGPSGGVLAWEGTNPDQLNGDEVWGVTLDPNGAAVGSPMMLSRSANGQELPAVSVSGELSWLLWRDDDRQPGPGNYQVSLYDQGPSSWTVDDHDLGSDTESWTRGTIAALGESEALAVWGDEGSSSHLGYGVVDVLGGIQASGVALGGQTGCLEPAAISHGDSVVVAVRCDSPTLWVTAYRNGGFVPDLAVSTLGSAITGPALGTDGTQVRLVWSDDRSGSPLIYGTRLDADGGSVDDAGVPLGAASGWQTRPAIASSDGTWLLAWEEDEGDGGTRIMGNRFAGDWNALDPAPLVLRQPDSKAGAPRLLSVSGGFLMAWEEDTHRGDVRAALVGTDGVVGTPFDISAGPEWEGQVSLAPGRTGSEVLAAYSALDPTDGVLSRRVYTRWIDLSGGTGTPENPPFDIGCDCSSAGGGAVWIALLLAAAAMLRRRRTGPPA